MAADDSRHILHTGVAYFDIISIKQFVVAMVWREMLIHKHQKLMGNVSRDILIIRRVEPYNFAFSLRFFVCRVLIVFDVGRMATLFQGFLIGRYSLVKFFCTA